MINFYSENGIYELIDYMIADIINKSALKLCNQLENEQDMINSNNIKKEILLLNDYLQYLLKNDFTEYQLVIDRQIEAISFNKKTLATTLLCNRFNKELNKILDNYNNNILIYNIIFEKQIYLNKLFSYENKILLKK